MTPKTGQRAAVVIATIATLCVWIGIASLAPHMWPAERETSAGFWASATFVDLTGRGLEGGSPAVMVRDDGAWTYVIGMDCSFVLWAPQDEVMKDFPRVIKELDRKSAVATDQTDPVAGYRRWRAFPAGQDGGVNGLLQSIQDARTLRVLNTLGKERPGPIADWNEMYVELRTVANKTRYFGANILFESLFFPGIIWFLLWPSIRAAGLRRRLLHAALTPFFLLMPLWLGYCIPPPPHTAPTGGILYPWMVFSLNAVRFEHNAAWETAFFRALPKLFGPLSQGVWDESILFDPFWTRFMYTPGPLQAAIASLIVCAGVLAVWYAPALYWRFRATRPFRGFEVIR